MREEGAVVLSDHVLERCRRGDEAAWSALYRLHSGTVLRFLRRVLGPQHDLEDVVQDVFAEVVRSLPRFRDESSLTTWLYGISSHVAHRHVRREIRWRRRREAWAEWLVSAAEPAPDGADGSEARKVLRVLGEALGDLGLKDREVWVLREWEGLSTEEVARALDVPEGTVRSRLFRARRSVADALSARGVTQDTGRAKEKS